MNRATVTAIAAFALLACVPFSGAHLTNPNGSATSKAWTGDECRYHGNRTENPGGVCPTNDGVSGTYVGTSGFAFYGDILPLTIGVQNATGDKVPERAICPNGNCLVASPLCDLEVLGSGSSPEPLDEEMVDNTAGGNVEDGTWDDGGYGGACHTSTYGEEGYNTGGCSGTSHAKDALSEGLVGLGTACDWLSPVTSGGPIACIINMVIQGGSDLENCVIVCIFISSCPDVGPTCGPDGSWDANNFGWGGGDIDEQVGADDEPNPLAILEGLGTNGNLTGKYGLGVPYPSEAIAASGCSQYDATAQSYVLDWVEANLGSVAMEFVDNPPLTEAKGPGEGTLPNVEYGLAVGGWIDWTNDANGESFVTENGLWVNTPINTPIECRVDLHSEWNPTSSCTIPCVVATGAPAGAVVVAATLTQGAAGTSITTVASGSCIPAIPQVQGAGIVSTTATGPAPATNTNHGITSGAGTITCTVTLTTSTPAVGFGRCIT